MNLARCGGQIPPRFRFRRKQSPHIATSRMAGNSRCHRDGYQRRCTRSRVPPPTPTRGVLQEAVVHGRKGEPRRASSQTAPLLKTTLKTLYLLFTKMMLTHLRLCIHGQRCSGERWTSARSGRSNSHGTLDLFQGVGKACAQPRRLVPRGRRQVCSSTYIKQLSCFH